MRRVAALAGVAIGALALGALVMVVIAVRVEVPIPLDDRREQISRALSEALNASVAVAGTLKAYTGPRAGFEAGQVRIASAGAGTPFEVRIDRLDVRLDPIALARRDVRVESIAAHGVRACIDRIAKAPASQPDRQRTDWRLVEIGHVRLQQMRIGTTADCDSDKGTLEVAQLDLRAPQDAPIHLSARGRFEGEEASLELNGPSLTGLLATMPVLQPFELAARYAGATLATRGEVDAVGRSVRVDVDADAPELARLLRPFATATRDLGPLKLRAHVEVGDSAVSVQVYEATVTPVQVNGDAAVAWSGPRPSFIFHGRTDRLDAVTLRRWLAGDSAAVPGDAARSTGEFERRLAAALRGSEGQVAIEVGRLSAGPVELSGVALVGTWDGGDVKGTARATWEASVVDGIWSVDLRRDTFEFAVAAKAGQLRVPARLGLKGSVDEVEAKLNGRGVLGGGRFSELRASVGARAARLQVPSGKGDTVALTLDRVRLQWGERDTAVLEASGSGFGEKFQARIEGANATALWQQRPWSFSANGQAGLLQGKAEGTLALLDGYVEARVDVDVHAERLGTLARGNAGLAALPLEAQAGVSLAPRGWSIDLSRLRVGQSLARATVQGSRQGAEQPLRTDLRFETLDVVELLGGSGTREAPDGMALPQRLVLPAADVELRASRVKLPGATIEAVSASGSIRDGRMLPSALAFELDGAKVEGTVAADLTGDTAALSVTAKAAGISERHFSAAFAGGRFRFEAGDVTLSAASSGNRPRELLANAQAELAAHGASLAFHGAGRKPVRSGTIASARLAVAPGQATVARLAGEWEGIPVSLEARGATLADLAGAADAPIHIDARVADIDVGVQGHLQRSRPLSVRIRAPTLDRFEAFTRYDLPSTGPFALDLTLRERDTERPSADLAITLGQSELQGKLSRRPGGERPLWLADLKFARLRLEDMGSAGWIDDDAPTNQQAVRPAPDRPATAVSARRERAQIVSDELVNALQRFDARVHLAVEKFSSGSIVSDRIEADAQLDAGRLQLGPVSAVGPIGRFALTADADFAAAEVPFKVDLALEQFDYGRLVRSIRPGHGATGKLGVRLHVAGRGRVGEPIPTLSGQLGLIVFPESAPGLKVLELWGAGLLRHLVTSLEPGQEAQVNCGVATFGIDRGVLKSQALMLDTANVRIAGELELDIARETLSGLVMPKAKRAQVVSLEVPISIGGTLAKPVIAPASGSVALATAKTFFVAYRYLYDVARSAALSVDGRPDCIAAYDRLAR